MARIWGCEAGLDWAFSYFTRLLFCRDFGAYLRPGTFVFLGGEIISELLHLVVIFKSLGAIFAFLVSEKDS